MSLPVLAPITGTVWKILVSVGDVVEVDQPLVLLESMKMEVPVCAPANGSVASVVVSVGDAVDDGDELATLSSTQASF